MVGHRPGEAKSGDDYTWGAPSRFPPWAEQGSTVWLGVKAVEIDLYANPAR